jgi:hypothetical protein
VRWQLCSLRTSASNIVVSPSKHVTNNEMQITVWRVLTKAASRVGSRAIKCSSNIVNAHVHLLAQDDGRQVSRIVRVICEILVEHTDKWQVEEITGGLQKWQQVVLPELTISPLHFFPSLRTHRQCRNGFRH